MASRQQPSGLAQSRHATPYARNSRQLTPYNPPGRQSPFQNAATGRLSANLSFNGRQTPTTDQNGSQESKNPPAPKPNASSLNATAPQFLPQDLKDAADKLEADVNAIKASDLNAISIHIARHNGILQKLKEDISKVQEVQRHQQGQIDFLLREKEIAQTEHRQIQRNLKRLEPTPAAESEKQPPPKDSLKNVKTVAITPEDKEAPPPAQCIPQSEKEAKKQ